MPILKKQLREKSSRSAKVERMVDAMACEICGVAFDAYNKSQNKKFLCLTCNGRLESGETALVSLDGRYAFIAGDGTPETEKFKGQIIAVPAATIDKLQNNENRN